MNLPSTPEEYTAWALENAGYRLSFLMRVLVGDVKQDKRVVQAWITKTLIEHPDIVETVHESEGDCVYEIIYIAGVYTMTVQKQTKDRDFS